MNWFQLSGVASLLRLGKEYLRPTADNHAVPLKYLSLEERWELPQVELYYPLFTCNLYFKIKNKGKNGTVVDNISSYQRMRCLGNNATDEDGSATILKYTSIQNSNKITSRFSGSIENNIFPSVTDECYLIIGCLSFQLVRLRDYKDGFFFRASNTNFDDVAIATNNEWQCVVIRDEVEEVVSSGVEIIEDVEYNFELINNITNVEFRVWVVGESYPTTPVIISGNIPQNKGMGVAMNRKALSGSESLEFRFRKMGVSYE